MDRVILTFVESIGAVSWRSCSKEQIASYFIRITINTSQLHMFVRIEFIFVIFKVSNIQLVNTKNYCDINF